MEAWLIRYHDHKQHYQQTHAPGRATRPMNSVGLRARERQRWFLHHRQPVDDQKQHDRTQNKHHVEMIHEPLQRRFVGHVPRKHKKQRHDHQNEEHMERSRRQRSHCSRHSSAVRPMSLLALWKALQTSELRRNRETVSLNRKYRKATSNRSTWIAALVSRRSLVFSGRR